MKDTDRSQLDALLDLLADEVARRLAASTSPQRREPEPTPPAPPAPVVSPLAKAAPMPASTPADKPVQQPTGASAPADAPVRELAPAEANVRVSRSSHAAGMMARLAVGICLVVVLINIPLNTQGTAIARSIPNSASLVIANGLVVKEETSPDIWVYRDGAFHWITSLEAFEHYGYRWEQVHVVEPGFLNAFEKGKPIYVLLKCDRSPHIYQLDAGQKRWIVDIPTFQEQGYIWEDVRLKPCTYLRSLPDGESIPPGRGTPPPPLP